MNEITQETHVAARPDSGLGYFRLKNPRKCIGRKKIPKIAVRSVDGQANVWKKLRDV